LHRLQALKDAFQTMSDLYDRLEEEWELDPENDEILGLIAGIRGALLQVAVQESGAFG
jgi:hypothetical protein